MKYIFGFLIFFGHMVSGSTQNKSLFLDAVAKADVAGLAQHFDSKIELCINNKIEYLDQQAASNSLKSFFDSNPPKSCQAIHKGSSKDKGSVYTIGSLQTTTGKTFRIYLYVEDNAGKALIKEIRIDKE